MRPQIAAFLLAQEKENLADVVQNRLTIFSDREQQVLAGYALGKKADRLSQDLGISVKTVESYVARIKEKLGTNSMSHATALFVKLQLTTYRRR